jgi:hypothetical protein
MVLKASDTIVSSCQNGMYLNVDRLRSGFCGIWVLDWFHGFFNIVQTLLLNFVNKKLLGFLKSRGETMEWKIGPANGFVRQSV